MQIKHTEITGMFFSLDFINFQNDISSSFSEAKSQNRKGLSQKSQMILQLVSIHGCKTCTHDERKANTQLTICDKL